MTAAQFHPSTSRVGSSRLYSYQDITETGQKERISKGITGIFVHNGGLCTSRRWLARSRPWFRSAGVARFSMMVNTVTLGSLATMVCHFHRLRDRGRVLLVDGGAI